MKIKKCCGVKPISSYRKYYDYPYFLTCPRCGQTVNMPKPERAVEYWNYHCEYINPVELGWASNYEVEE